MSGYRRTSISSSSDDGEAQRLPGSRGQESDTDDDDAVSWSSFTYGAYHGFQDSSDRGTVFRPPSPPPRPPGIAPPSSAPLLFLLPAPTPTPRLTPLLLDLGYYFLRLGEYFLREASILQGGNATTPTRQTPQEAPQEAEEISYLPALRRWLLENSAIRASGAPAGPTPTARCAICLASRLDITELQPPPPQRQPGGPPSDEDECELAAVMFCGHMFGRDCLADWLGSNSGSWQEYACPTCRDTRYYGSCGHSVPGLCIDSCGGVLGVPHTLSEGGRIPDHCDRCRVSASTDLHDGPVGWGNRDVMDGIELWQSEADSVGSPGDVETDSVGSLGDVETDDRGARPWPESPRISIVDASWDIQHRNWG